MKSFLLGSTVVAFAVVLTVAPAYAASPYNSPYDYMAKPLEDLIKPADEVERLNTRRPEQRRARDDSREASGMEREAQRLADSLSRESSRAERTGNNESSVARTASSQQQGREQNMRQNARQDRGQSGSGGGSGSASAASNGRGQGSGARQQARQPVMSQQEATTQAMLTQANQAVQAIVRQSNTIQQFGSGQVPGTNTAGTSLGLPEERDTRGTVPGLPDNIQIIPQQNNQAVRVDARTGEVTSAVQSQGQSQRQGQQGGGMAVLERDAALSMHSQ